MLQAGKACRNQARPYLGGTANPQPNRINGCVREILRLVVIARVRWRHPLERIKQIKLPGGGLFTKNSVEHCRRSTLVDAAFPNIARRPERQLQQGTQDVTFLWPDE